MGQTNLSERNNGATLWILNNLTKSTVNGITIIGDPGVQRSILGDAVTFNGSSDAIFLDTLPIKGLERFTIEVIFQPSGGGQFEQRFLHLGEIQGDRVLLELRSTATDWYFDAFIKVGEQQCTLIDPELLHPLNQWYHLAYVIDNGKLSTYVNGIKELEGNVILSPVKSGRTSIGVRQNQVSWFRGMIYAIRITATPLSPQEFLKF